jgi:threonylcarbamoyladenosine tRNA methylthiotransferase MtaB
VENVISGGDLDEVAAALGLDPWSAALRPAAQQGVRALLRVQDGCDEHCTFCATTLARGASRSRDPRAVGEEALRLADHHEEIVITGVHIGHYGWDIGTTLGALMERLVEAVPMVRFRLTSVEATEVCERLRALWSSARDRLVPHLHAPLQSGSDRVLRRMGRHWYSAARYANAVESLVPSAPYFALGADLIAGFPGENEADHRASVDLVRALPFTYLHVFPYSERPGTAAVRLGAPVAHDDIKRRAAELRTEAASAAARYAASRTGGPADVVVIPRGARREGLTEDYLAVGVTDQSLPRGARFNATLKKGHRSGARSPTGDRPCGAAPRELPIGRYPPSATAGMRRAQAIVRRMAVPCSSRPSSSSRIPSP